MTRLDRIRTHVQFTTKDPKFPIEGMGDAPAMTTMLYRVCNNDPEKFEEACRIVDLFIDGTVNAIATGKFDD